MPTRRQELRVVISGDPSGLKRAFSQAETAAGRFERGVGGTMSRVGAAMRRLSTGALAGAGLGFGALLKAGVDYEKQMARVRAVTNATGAQFKGLGDLAKQLGKDTKFSAGQAAEAMYELGSAGFKAEEMAKVLPGTLALAAASSIELADAAEISSNALRGFGLRNEQSAHVADVLAQAVNASSIEMRDLQYTLKYIGPVARLTGQDFETMIAAVELMGNAGIKGEQAGTTLRGALVRLTKPTVQVREALRDVGLSAGDLRGPKGLKPLPQLIGLLAQHMQGLTKAQRNQRLATIFGTEALSGMSVLVTEGADKLRDLAQANRDSEGAAKKAADTMNSTVAGAWENFTGTIETAGIALYEKFQEPLRDALLTAASTINDFAPDFQTLRSGGRDAATAFVEAFGNAIGLESNAQKLGPALTDMFNQVDWQKIGDKIADGIGTGLKLSGDLGDAVADGIGQALSKIDGRKMLSGLLRVVSEAIDALFSPSFWEENFENIFASVTIAIPIGKILKIPGAEWLFQHISKPFFKAVGRLGKGLVGRLGSVAEDALTGFLAGIEKIAPRTANVLLSLVTGTGRWLKGLPGRLRGAGNRGVDALTAAIGGGASKVAEQVGKLVGAAIRGLGKLVPDFARTGARMAADLVSGLVSGLRSIPRRAGGAIKKALGAIGGLFGIGEGIGRAVNRTPAGGGGDLMGARRAMGPIAAVGARFGLHVSSGRRPGSITSSGNVSYHSTGEALDEAGAPGQMLRFFRYMRDRYGPRLAELIYTPGGTGIKDGRPYRYTGQVARDHFDHVHVALDTGRSGVGDGLGKFVATSYGPPWGGIQGTGVTASGVNLKGSPHIYGIAADPRVLPLGSRVKAWPNPFGYRGAFRVFDTGGAIKGRRIDFYDWRGRGAQNSWGSRTVTLSTVTGGSRSGGGGSTREQIQRRLDANLDKLDVLRDRLARLPRGRAGRSRRDALRAQIRALVSQNRGLRGQARDLPSTADIRDEQEREGSRAVNQIVARFQPALGKATRGAARLGAQLEDADTAYGQLERALGQTDEDTTTVEGKARRLGELAALRQEKQKQLASMRKRAQYLKRAISKLEGLLRDGRKARDRSRGTKRAKIIERLRKYQDDLTDLRAELKSLGVSITDTQLDVGDLLKEAREVAAAAPESVEAASVSDRLGEAISDIDLQERAGLLSAADAAARREQVRQIALAMPGLTDRERWQIMGDLRDATAEQTQATAELTAALDAATKAQQEANMIAQTRVAVGLREAERAITDLISGQLGYRVQTRSYGPGDGRLARL